MPHPYDEFIHLVTRPARYVGGEYRSVRKPWDATPIRAVLAYPDVYEIGMSHLGLRILYDRLNALPDILAERVFAPWVDLEAELRARRIPLVSLESARPLAEFDCVGFSLQYELTFTNLLNMLDLAGLPLRSRDRSGSHPLVIAGGPGAVQPEALAPFIDCFLIGEGEDMFPEFLRRHAALRAEGLDRAGVLRRLGAIPGVYCPALHEVETDPATGLQVVRRPRPPGVPVRIARQFVPDLARHPFPAGGPVPSTEAIFDRYAVEIARGCTEGCRFCQAGFIYRPMRERSPDDIFETMLRAVRETGYDDVSLTSLSTADYSCISPLVVRLMKRLREEKVALSVSSLRAYGLPDELLDAIGSVRNTSLTFAPEAGTQRMRDVISKNISEEDMERSAHGVFSRGWKKAKLYFMIGLPTEEEEDIRAIVRTAQRYLEIADRYHRRGSAEVTVSVSTFVPKPHTPFQWARMIEVSEIRAKQDLLMDLTRGLRVRLKWHDPQISLLEAIMSRGDRRVADLIEYAFRNGCRFDGWGEQFRFETWQRGLDELQIDVARYLRGAPVDGRLPWDHIDVGVTEEYLKSEYRKALANRLTPPCGKPYRADMRGGADSASRARLVCFDCGMACDLEKMASDRPAAVAEQAGETARSLRDLDDIRDRNDLPRTCIENAVKLRYRLRFTKLGPQRFISHLDLVRLLPRVFRRAGVGLAYSRGFHPKPIMTFSPALGLGWGSRGEFLDVVLADGLDPLELIGRLDPASPEGIRFLGAARLDTDDAGLARVIDAVDFDVALPADFDLGSAQSRLDAFARGEPVLVPRDRTGAGPFVDIARAVRSIEIVAADRPAGEDGFANDGFGAAGDKLLRVRMLADNTPAARPGEVGRWLTGRLPAPQHICRTGLWKLEGDAAISPLDLPELRAIRARRAAPRPDPKGPAVE